MARRTAKQVIADVKHAVQTERDQLALEVIYEVSRRPPEGTPVKTNWARANWIPQLGGEVSGSAIVRRPAVKGAVSNAGARQQAAIAALVTQGPSQPDAVVHVYNPVGYMPRLADGWSKQSPAGWVDAAVQRASDTCATRARAKRVKL